MLKKPDLQNKKIGREDNNMIIENAIEKLEARIKCAEQLKRGLCNDNDCVNCKIGYEQGTVEEQIEALKAAVNALQDQLNTKNKGENNMLTLVSINKKVQEELKKCGYESEEVTLVKNGLEKKGLKIENGCICPIIYPVDMVKAGKTIDSIVQNNDQSGLIYLSNKDNYYGAAVIYIKDFLRDMAQKFESDLVILPSSIHEALCYADNNWREEKDKINAMVKEVNNTMVSPEEILSNHAYFYNKATDQIEW